MGSGILNKFKTPFRFDEAEIGPIWLICTILIFIILYTTFISCFSRPRPFICCNIRWWWWWFYLWKIRLRQKQVLWIFNVHYESCHIEPPEKIKILKRLYQVISVLRPFIECETFEKCTFTMHEGRKKVKITGINIKSALIGKHTTRFIQKEVD